MAFQTVSELREDALFMAGEVSTDTGGSYYAKALDYLEATYRSVLMGEPLGPARVPMVDWWWARTVRASDGGGHYGAAAEWRMDLKPKVTAVTSIALTLNGATVTMSPTPSSGLGSFKGFSLVVPNGNSSWSGYLTAHTAGSATATLSANYPYASGSFTNFTLVKTHYLIDVENFGRLTDPIRLVGSGDPIRVIDRTQMEAQYPIAGISQSQPVFACLDEWSYDGTTLLPGVYLRFSHYPSVILTATVPYLPVTTTTLGTSDVIGMPGPYRRLLSYGAAYLIALDKGDQQNISARYGQFEALWQTMAAEQVKQTSQGGRLFARVLHWNAYTGPARVESVSGLKF